MGSAGNTLAIFRFTETTNSENVKVTQLPVIDLVSATSGSAAFTNLTLWNGSTELGSVGSAGTVTTTIPTNVVTSSPAVGYYLYNFQIQGNPIIVPQANSVSITLKGDATGYSTGAADDVVNQFEVATTTLAGITALGQSSNLAATTTLANAYGNPQTVLRTTLTPSVNSSVADGTYFVPSIINRGIHRMISPSLNSWRITPVGLP